MTKTCKKCEALFESDDEARELCDACLAAQVPAGDVPVTETPVGTPVTETPAAGDSEPTV